MLEIQNVIKTVTFEIIIQLGSQATQMKGKTIPKSTHNFQMPRDLSSSFPQHMKV